MGSVTWYLNYCCCASLIIFALLLPMWLVLLPGVLGEQMPLHIVDLLGCRHLHWGGRGGLGKEPELWVSLLWPGLSSLQVMPLWVGGQWVLWAPLKPEGHCHRLFCHCCLVVRGCRHVRRFPPGHRLSHQGFSIAGTASAVLLARPPLGVRSPMSRYTDVWNSPASQSVEQQNLCWVLDDLLVVDWRERQRDCLMLIWCWHQSGYSYLFYWGQGKSIPFVPILSSLISIALPILPMLIKIVCFFFFFPKKLWIYNRFLSFVN